MRSPGPLSRPWPGWAHAALGALLLGSGLGVAIVGQQVATDRRAWRLTRELVARAATEGGAHELWIGNPALHQDYPDEAAFLSAVRTGLRDLGDLPLVEPPSRQGSPWWKVASPWNLQTTARGSAGGWMHLQIQRSGPLEDPQGEGLTFLAFAPDLEGLRRFREGRHERRILARFERMRQVADQLSSPERTRAFWKREPALHDRFPTPDALEMEVVGLRTRLRHLPRVPQAPDVDLHHLQSPFHDRVDLRWRTPEGGEVAMAWEGDALVDVHLEPTFSDTVGQDPS